MQRFGFLCVGRVVSHASGDRRAYTDQARAQRNKDFEEITVTFDEPPEQ